MEVNPTAERAWIDSVGGFSSAEQASSIHGAQARILEMIEHPLTCDDLVYIDGFAFRTGAHDQMCPSAALPCCAYMAFDWSLDSRPCRIRSFLALSDTEPMQDEEAFREQVYTAVKDSIDRGVLVHYGAEEGGLISDYAE